MTTRGRSLRAAVIGILIVAGIVIAALHVDQLPLIGRSGSTYQAAFTDAGGLKAGDPVEVSGIPSGQVTGISIGRAQIIVHFTLDSSIRLGSRTRAAIKIGTLLGAKFLDVEPSGPGRLASDALIPLRRTTPAYDIVAAFSTLTTTTEKIDRQAVAQAMDTIATTFANSPHAVHDSLRGLAAFSQTIASRNQQIADLLHHARVTTGLLAERRGDIVALMRASTQFLAEIQARRAAVVRLLDDTSALFAQLRALIAENQAALTPALGEVHTVLTTLASHQAELRTIVRNMDLFVRLFTNTLGSGPWFDSVIPNLPTHASLGGGR